MFKETSVELSDLIVETKGSPRLGLARIASSCCCPCCCCCCSSSSSSTTIQAS